MNDIFRLQWALRLPYFTDLPFFIKILSSKNDNKALAIESTFSSIILSFAEVSIAILKLADWILVDIIEGVDEGSFDSYIG